MADAQQPKLYMVTVEFTVPVLATSARAAEEHAQVDYEIWSDQRGMLAWAHAREVIKAAQLGADERKDLPYFADVDDDGRTCEEWVTP